MEIERLETRNWYGIERLRGWAMYALGRDGAGVYPGGVQCYTAPQVELISWRDVVRAAERRAGYVGMMNNKPSTVWAIEILEAAQTASRAAGLPFETRQPLMDAVQYLTPRMREELGLAPRGAAEIIALAKVSA
jgi:hypothetical protein